VSNDHRQLAHGSPARVSGTRRACPVARAHDDMAGSVDDVSIYLPMRRFSRQATGTTPHLLTFDNANHNAAAPMPATRGKLAGGRAVWISSPSNHYADPVWGHAAF